MNRSEIMDAIFRVGRKAKDFVTAPLNLSGVVESYQNEMQNPNPTLGDAAKLMSLYMIPSALPRLGALKKGLPDARFIGPQSFGEGEPTLNLYNITRKGHPREGSTVTADTLISLGLRVPKT